MINYTCPTCKTNLQEFRELKEKMAIIEQRGKEFLDGAIEKIEKSILKVVKGGQDG